MQALYVVYKDLHNGRGVCLLVNLVDYSWIFHKNAVNDLAYFIVYKLWRAQAFQNAQELDQ